ETLSQWSAQADGPQRLELDRAMARLQGASGVLLRWHISGPLTARTGSLVAEQLARARQSRPALDRSRMPWQVVIGFGTEARVHVSPAPGAGPDSVWLASTEVIVSEPTAVQLLASAF